MNEKEEIKFEMGFESGQFHYSGPRKMKMYILSTFQSLNINGNSICNI